MVDQVIEGIMDPLGVLLAGGLDIADNGAFTCVLIGVGGEALVRVRVRDDGGTANQGVDLSAAAEFTIAFAPSADLQVEKDDGCNGVQIGETLVYSITVANAGPNAAVGATVADDIPPTLAEAEWACVEASSNATCPPAPFDTGTGDMTTTIDLPVDAFLRFELSATMLGQVGSNVTNTVQVAPPAGLADPVADNNASTDTTLIEPNGIFSDDFESEGTGLHVPTAKHAQAKSRRL